MHNCRNCTLQIKFLMICYNKIKTDPFIVPFVNKDHLMAVYMHLKLSSQTADFWLQKLI